MITIWKFKLDMIDNNEIVIAWKPVYELWIPVGAEFLSLREQYNEAEMWFKVDATANVEQRKFLIVGTGRKIKEKNAKFLGTFLLNQGSFVGHVFELIDE